METLWWSEAELSIGSVGLASSERGLARLFLPIERERSEAEKEKARLDIVAKREEVALAIAKLHEERRTTEHDHKLKRETLRVQAAAKRKAANQPRKTA